MRLILLALFSIFSYSLAAQYAVNGKLIDENEESVPFAQVAVFDESNTDDPVQSSTTDINGNFTFNLENGSYQLKIFTIGFEDKTLNFAVSGGTENLNTISLITSSESLDEVVIEGKQIRKPIEATATGITVRPDQNLSNDGGSVLDVLRSTPSITVADDGSISIRGSNGTNVLIDGRNSALGEELDQIPANAVESIEIINNPDSKYDAESGGGILDIKLKKGKGKGTKGSVQTTVGTRGRTNSSIRLNHRSDKFNVYGGYNFRYWPGLRTRESQRTDFTTNEVLDQTGRNLRYPVEHTLNYGGDYFFGKNKLSYEGSSSLQSRTESQDTRVRLYDRDTEETILQYTRLGDEDRNESIFDNALIYERMFDDTTKSFRTYASHSFRNRDSNQDINAYSGTLSPENRDPSGRERFTIDRFIQRGVFQSDYAQNLFGGRFETGVKYNLRMIDNDYQYEIADENGIFINQEEVTNRFIYTEQISAGYVQYSNEIGNLEYSFGSRVEWSLIDTEQRTTNEIFNQNYINLFPSAQLLYNFNDEHAVKASYSRRIDRPGGWRLNPFRDVTDSLNQREGNPFLQPEYIDSYEVGYLYSTDKVATVANIFYRKNHGIVDYLLRIEDGVSIRSPQNLLFGETYGLEVIQTAEIFPWWTINGSVSLFVQNIDGTNLDEDYVNSGFTWNAKATTDFNLPWNIDLQFTGWYRARDIEAQGIDYPRYNIDGTVQRKFLKNKLTASLIFRDMFNIREFRGENGTRDFFQDFVYKRETQIVLLSLKYSI